MIRTGSASVSVHTRACVLICPWGSLMSTHLMCTGGLPQRYQTAVSDVISSVRSGPSFQGMDRRIHDTSGRSRSCPGDGSRCPLTRGRPICPGSLGGAGSKRAASSLSLLMKMTGSGSDWQLCSSLSAAYPPSETTTIVRSGSHRCNWKIICRAQSVIFLCGRPILRWYLSGGARAVSTGSAHVRLAKGM